MKKHIAPELRNDFIIVVHKDKPGLACTVLSYLFQGGKYIPVFSFPKVDVPLHGEVQNPDIYAIQRRRAEKFGVALNNVLAVNGKGDNVIFLGLTEEQKSYLTFKEHCNVMEINDSASIEAYLGGFGADRADVLECSIEQLFVGFCQAIRGNNILRIGAFNHHLEKESFQYNGGVVGIEAKENSNTIIGINYALSVGADVALVEPLKENDDDLILNLIEEWDKGDEGSLKRLEDMITERIGLIDFAQFPFATFFTHGLHYSLYVSNIPCSLVNLSYQPDFFIFNTIYSEKSGVGGTAAIFSPVFFKNDEETENLVRTFESKNYYLRKLIGKKAQSANLRSTILHFPFDVLHICSHGGSVSGTRCSVTFHDKDNIEHVIEFDHVLGIAIYPGVEKHPIESYYYFRKLDGLVWRSKELKAKNYSHEFYATLSQEISSAFDKKKVVHGEKIAAVANTNAIVCASFCYHASFDQMGGQMFHPFIFNNSCWSWMKISTNFLYNGARGYVGTMRTIPNGEAVQFAEKFYEQVFDNNIIDAFYSATTEHLKSSAEPNYVFWGLHFSGINNTKTAKQNRSEVLKQLGTSYAVWNDKYVKKEGAKDILVSYIREIKALCNEIIMENIPPSMLRLPSPPAKIPLKGGKIGRNDPCPCGSGKKYKNCHISS
jgi:hypothetical protein